MCAFPGQQLTVACRRLTAFVAIAAVALSLNACITVRLAGDYDQQIDASATDMQKRMDAFLTRLETLPAGDPGRSYGPNQQFYLDYAVDLRAVETRARSLPKNSITVQQVQLMESSVEELRNVHQAQDDVSNAAIGQYGQLFNTAWTAVLTWELAKKR